MCHRVLYCNLSKKKAGKLAGRTVPSTERRVTRGNGQKEEEAVMSRSDCVSCPTFLSIPPADTRRSWGVGCGLERTEETGGERGIKEDWSVDSGNKK